MACEIEHKVTLSGFLPLFTERMKEWFVSGLTVWTFHEIPINGASKLIGVISFFMQSLDTNIHLLWIFISYFVFAIGTSDLEPWYAYSFGDREIVMRAPSSPLAGKECL